MSTKIGVAIRIRPFLQQEINLAMQGSKLQVLPHEKEIRVPSEDQRGYKSFKFDKVLQEETTQDQIFAKTQIQDLVNKVVEGYHSTIFAYGQTGSGKTYTMEGYKYELDPNGTELNALINPNSRDAGIIPRAVKGLFNTIKSNSKANNRTYTVYCSYLQIYNEKIFDLLNPAQLINANSNKTNAGLRLRWTAKDQFTVENLFIFECKSADEVLGLFHQGIKNKMMASHKLNLTSSRSHCILSLRVESVDSKTSEGLISSKLDLVDLAGSERTSQTGNETQMAQKESIEINKSLFTLRQVISTLSDAQDKKKDKMYAPFRDSKLTSLLKQSIGGNSFCLMIACLSPADRYFEENLSTLTYATKAAYISNEPHKNEDPKTRLISTLKVQVGSLAKELDRANYHISFLSQLTNEKIKGFPTEPSSNDKNETNGFRNTLAKTAANHKNSTHTSLFNHTRFAKRDINSQQTPSRQRRDQSFDETPVNKNKQHPHQHTNYSSSSQDRAAAARFHSEDLKSPEMLQERLTESINTVKDLLRTNKELRTHMDKYRDENETLQGELFHLHKENQDLRERLTVFESLFNNEGSKMNNNNRGGPPSAGPVAVNKYDEDSVAEESRRVEEEEEENEEISESDRRIKSEKRSDALVHELTQEVANLRLTKKALENKVRDVEIENMNLQQKFLPTRKPNAPPPDASFNSHQYYQNLITRTKYNQKMLQDPNQSDILQGDVETTTTLPRDTPDSVYQTPMRSKGDRMGTGYDQNQGQNQTRYSSLGAENRARTDENNGVVAIGSYLPKLRTEASDFNNNYHQNGQAMNSSPSAVKKSSNVWLTGLFKKRANSTLRRIGTGNKLSEKSGSRGKTLEEMEKSALSPRRFHNK